MMQILKSPRNIFFAIRHSYLKLQKSRTYLTKKNNFTIPMAINDFSLFTIDTKIHSQLPKMVRKENVVDYEIIIIIIKIGTVESDHRLRVQQ